MRWRYSLAAGLGAALCTALLGCGLLNLSEFLNGDLLSSLGVGSKVASLPGDAPGLLVAVENRTTRPCQVQIAYRDANDTVTSYVTNVAPGDRNAQMLVCPVAEITLGDVSNLDTSGARVYLVDGTGADADTLAAAPFVEVEAFGVLLREEVNYDCGDGLTFTVEPSSQSRSGYQTFAYRRPASQ